MVSTMHVCDLPIFFTAVIFVVVGEIFEVIYAQTGSTHG